MAHTLRKIIAATAAAFILAGTGLLSACRQEESSMPSVSDPNINADPYNVREGEAVPKPAKADKLRVYPMDNEALESKKAVYALQGLINQQQAEVYVRGSSFIQDRQWIDQLQGYYSEIETVKIEEDTTLLQLFKDYKDRIKRVYIYDPTQEKDYTWTLAVTMSSLNSGIPLSYGLYQIIQAQLGYEGEVIDLRERWPSQQEAYDYMIEELLPHTSKQVVFCIDPFMDSRTVDYAMASRAVVFWLNETERDDKKILERIFSSDHFVENAIIMGYGDASNGKSGDDLLNAGNPYGFGFVATTWFANGSVFASIDNVSLKEQRPGKAVEVDEDKTYVCMFWSDGDNLQYDQLGLRAAWDNDNRGKIPVASTIAPLLAEAAPPIMQWYYDNMGENDELIAGPSGWQFIYPQMYEKETLKAWGEKNRKWLANSGIRVANMWRTNVREDRSIITTILAESDIDGVFTPDMSAYAYEPYDIENTLVFNAPGNVWYNEPGELYNDFLQKFLPQVGKPAKFVAINNILEGVKQKGFYDTIVAEVAYAEEQSPDTFVFLRPSDFIATYRKYMESMQ